MFFYFIFLITYECLIFTFLRRTNLTSKLNLIFVQFVVYCIVPVVQYVHIVGAGAAKLGDTGAGALQNCVFYRAPGHWDQSRHTLFSTEPLDTGTGAATLYFLKSPWTSGVDFSWDKALHASDGRSTSVIFNAGTYEVFFFSSMFFLTLVEMLHTVCT